MTYTCTLLHLLTISSTHLHPATRRYIEERDGNLEWGPQIAVRDEGYILQSYLGWDDPLEYDCIGWRSLPLIEIMPDLVLIRAFARSLGAAWIDINYYGDQEKANLPTYDCAGRVSLPTDDPWRRMMSRLGASALCHNVVKPTIEELKEIERTRPLDGGEDLVHSVARRFQPEVG